MANCPSCKTYNFDRFTSCTKCGHLLEAFLDAPILAVGHPASGRLTFYPDRIECEKDHLLVGRDMETIKYEDISKVTVHSGIRAATLLIVANGGAGMSVGLSKDDADAARIEIDKRRRTSIADRTSTAPVDIPGQIAQLAQLRDARVITDEEFQAKKVELLKRL